MTSARAPCEISRRAMLATATPLPTSFGSVLHFETGSGADRLTPIVERGRKQTGDVRVRRQGDAAMRTGFAAHQIDCALRGFDCGLQGRL